MNANRPWSSREKKYFYTKFKERQEEYPLLSRRRICEMLAPNETGRTALAIAFQINKILNTPNEKRRMENMAPVSLTDLKSLLVEKDVPIFRSWNREQDRKLVLYVRDGKAVSEGLKKFCEETGKSFSSARSRYYQVRKLMRSGSYNPLVDDSEEDPTPRVEEVEVQEPTEDPVQVRDDSSELEKRVELLEGKLSLPLAEHIYNALKGPVEEVETLRRELDVLREERQKLQFDLEARETLLQEAEDLIEMWTRMASLSQVFSFGDFKTKMVTIMDKWGSIKEVRYDRCGGN